jgi:hypothetical protein
MTLWESDLWKIELIEPGLIPNPILQKSKNHYGFFDLKSPIYMPLAIYPGTDAFHTQHSLPQGTLIQWRDKCIKMFEERLRYNSYMALYNDMKGNII